MKPSKPLTPYPLPLTSYLLPHKFFFYGTKIDLFRYNYIEFIHPGGKMKRLYKSRKNKTIAGVCGGIAEYFDIDPVLVRLIFILFFFIGGSAILAYIVGMIIMPNPPAEPVEATETKTPSPKPSTDTVTVQKKPAPAPASRSNASLIIGIILVLVGAYFLMGNLPFLREYYWWFRWHLRDFFVPGIFIILGIILLIHGSRKDQENS